MSIFIRRKRLFEEGEQNVQNQQNTAPQQTTTTQTAPQQPAQNTEQTVQNTQQQNVTPQQTQNTQQPVQSQNTEAQEKAQQRNAGVTELINTWKDGIEKGNIYAALAVNIPAVIGNKFNGFNNDPDAKATIDAWQSFEKEPNKEKFETFVNEFTKFGNGGQEVTDQSVENPAPASGNNDNAGSNQNASASIKMGRIQMNDSEQMKAVNVQKMVEARSKSFSDRLNEHIEKKRLVTHAEQVLEKFYNQQPMKFNL